MGVHVRTDVSYVYAMLDTFMGRLKYKRKDFLLFILQFYIRMLFTQGLGCQTHIVLCSEQILQNHPNLTT